jgi:azobenzene reductase
MKTLILVGSGDANSHSLSLGNAIKIQLESNNIEVELINLIDYGLPLYDRTIERGDSYDQATREFLQKSYDADAFVWVTPIHHNSFSAILKNALHWQHTKFPGKVVGLASNGGNRSPQAVDQLMSVARAQHLITTRVRVCTDSSDYDTELNLTNEAIRSRVVDFSNELIEVATKFRS